ncbi:hypothetical protein [Haloarcula halophila]|uniref:hypothetical protein n=1 Tax=Haloarcula TaxID=2237 RepID=UPI0023E45E6B|nr:hypothetical protein [Halomicroarcula sp. DFY41]
MSRPSLPCSRRRALQAVGSAVVTGLTGCLSPSERSDQCPNSVHLSFDEATPVGVSNEFSTPVDALAHATQTTVVDALDSESGEATTRGYYSPKPHTDYVVTGSQPRYYRVETADHDGTPVPGYEYAVDIDVDEPAGDDHRLSFPDLPPHDRESLRDAIGNSHLIHAPHYDSFAVTFAYERADARSRSVFVPERETWYLEWQDTLLRLTFSEQRTVEITTTTVSTELVAESPEAFVEYVGGERGVVLDGLTDRQREIVDQAVDGTYTDCEPDSAAFEDLRDRLSIGSDSPAALARYDGQWYFTGLGPLR